MRRATKKKKYPIRYTYKGVTTEYVDRLEEDLYPELLRIHKAIKRSVRSLLQMRFSRHIVLQSVDFLLQQCLERSNLFTEKSSAKSLALEIGWTSTIMQECLELLDRLKNVGVSYFKDLKFTLTYGQTPQKRHFDNPVAGTKEASTELSEAPELCNTD